MIRRLPPSISYTDPVQNPARALLVYTALPLGPSERDPELQKYRLAQRFAKMSWAVPQIFASLPSATDLYVDAIAKGNSWDQDDAARKSASVTIRIIGSSGEASKPNRT